MMMMIIMVVILDINECDTDVDNCADNAVCTNTDGGFTCECNSGFTGDGVTCTGKIYM